MSKWLSVNSSFRLRSFRLLTESEILDIFGRQSNIRNSFVNDGTKNLLPKGSEGTLNINIWLNSDREDTDVATVNVFGDLRDFSNISVIEEWFNKCCESAWVDQAVCQIVSVNDSKVLQFS